MSKSMSSAFMSYKLLVSSLRCNLFCESAKKRGRTGLTARAGSSLTASPTFMIRPEDRLKFWTSLLALYLIVR